MFYWSIEKRLALAVGMIGIVTLLCCWALELFA